MISDEIIPSVKSAGLTGNGKYAQLWNSVFQKGDAKEIITPWRGVSLLKDLPARGAVVLYPAALLVDWFHCWTHGRVTLPALCQQTVITHGWQRARRSLGLMRRLPHEWCPLARRQPSNTVICPDWISRSFNHGYLNCPGRTCTQLQLALRCAVKHAALGTSISLACLSTNSLPGWFQWVLPRQEHWLSRVLTEQFLIMRTFIQSWCSTCAQLVSTPSLSSSTGPHLPEIIYNIFILYLYRVFYSLWVSLIYICSSPSLKTWKNLFF